MSARREVADVRVAVMVNLMYNTSRHKHLVSFFDGSSRDDSTETTAAQHARLVCAKRRNQPPEPLPDDSPEVSIGYGTAGMKVLLLEPRVPRK